MNPTEGSVAPGAVQARYPLAPGADGGAFSMSSRARSAAGGRGGVGAQGRGGGAEGRGGAGGSRAATDEHSRIAADELGSFAAGSHPEFDAGQRARLRAIEARLVDGEAGVRAWSAERAELMCAAAEIAAEAAARSERNSRCIEMPYRSIAASLSAELRISGRTVERELDEAPRLVHEFSATHAALRAARISRAHADAIVRAGATLPDPEARADYEAAIVPIAERETPGRTRHLAGVLAARVDGRTFADRHTAAAADRGIRIIDLSDGMSEFTATVPTVFAHAVKDRLLQMAHSIIDARPPRQPRRGPGSAFGRAAMGAVQAVPATTAGVAAGVAAGAGVDAEAGAGARAAAAREAQVVREEQDTRDEQDARKVQELCADVFLELCLAGSPSAHTGKTALGSIQGRVQISISMLSLMGRNDNPATLAGIGPIDAATARAIAGAASGWDRVLTHPITGTVLAVDRYTPSAELKRTLRVRDQHCRFLGCRQPVHQTDLDHTQDYALGGETRESNLAHLCRRHHMLKHASAWTVVQRPGGILEWTSPTGKVHADIPISTVMFKPDPDWNDWLAAADADPGADPPPF